MRFAASSNEMFHLLLFAIGSNEFVLVAHDLVSGAVTANRHSHGDCQHPACIMLLGYHWADVLPLQPLIGRLRHYSPRLRVGVSPASVSIRSARQLLSTTTWPLRLRVSLGSHTCGPTAPTCVCPLRLQPTWTAPRAVQLMSCITS